MLRNKKGILFAGLAILIFGIYLVGPYLGGKPATQRLDRKPTEPVFKKEGEGFWVKANGDTLPLLDLEFAETPEEIEIGLMYRKSMDANKGMLFHFNREQPRSFWMRNTVIGLDIIYIDSEFKMVSAAENAKPFSEQSLPSAGPAQYVLEVNAGYVHQNGLQTGDRFVLK